MSSLATVLFKKNNNTQRVVLRYPLLVQSFICKIHNKHTDEETITALNVKE